MLAQNLDAIQSAAGVSLPFNDVGGLISRVLPYVMGIAAIALLVYLIMGGLQLMTSRGDPKAVQAAQAKISNAVLGFVIVFLSFAIVSILGRVLKIGVFVDIFNK